LKSGGAPAGNIISKAELALFCKVSRAAVSKALREMRLVETARGKIDIRRKVNRLFIALHLQKQEEPPDPAPTRKPVFTVHVDKAGKGPLGGNGKGKLPLPIQKLIAEIELRREQVQTHRLKRLRTLDRLMDRQAVEQGLARFNAELEVRLLDLPRRIGPRLTALAKTGDEAGLISTLEDELTVALRQVKERAII